jgi:hypothetical protein
VTPGAASVSREEAAALLGVPVDASASDVQRAYLRAARHTHPDVLPDADEAGRIAAAAAFDRLTRARDLLVAGGGPVPVTPPVTPRPPASDRYRRGRGLGGAFVVLALLGFLLIGIVATEEALIGDPTQVPDSTRTP